jgi:hypothetical protein
MILWQSIAADLTLQGKGCALGWFSIHFFAYTEPKTLRQRRVDPIEDGICSGAFHPRGGARRVHTAARLRELNAGVSFGALQTSGE